ncbi:MAG: hypothetical protein AAGF83_07730 [Cyanobacteria bacterium P01_G01_bin.67]
MSQPVQRPFPTKTVEKIIKGKIKNELSAKGINTTTKQGNKELKFLVNKVATHPFENQSQIDTTGDKLGSYLSELFQQKNKQNLDASLIQQVTSRKDFWSLAGLAPEIPIAESSSSAQPEQSVAPPRAPPATDDATMLSENSITNTTSQVEVTDNSTTVVTANEEQPVSPTAETMPNADNMTETSTQTGASAIETLTSTLVTDQEGTDNSTESQAEVEMDASR